MRLKNSLKNIIFDIIYSTMLILFNFIIRKQIINIIGIEIIGLQNILNQALNVISLAELGISNVITFNLYKPLKEKSTKKIIQIMQTFKSFYNKVCVTMLVGGILFIPFLHLFIHDYNLNINYYVIYLLFLIQSATSYLFSYKMILLEADQKLYNYRIIQLIAKTLTFILELIVFMLTKNYYVYIIMDISNNLLINYLSSLYVTYKYKYLKSKVEPLPKKELNTIKKDIKDIFIGKLCGMVTTSSDTFILSSMSTVTVVGLYSNYYVVLFSIQRILQKIIQNTQSSIANKLIGETKETKAEIFNTLNFLSYILALFSSLSYFIMITFVIKIWIGESFIMDKLVELAFSLQLFTFLYKTNLWQFTTIEGLFKINKNSSIVGAILNIVLSILFYLVIGVSGVILATVISQLVQYYLKLYYLAKKIEVKMTSLMKNDLVYYLIFIIMLGLSILLENYIFSIILCILILGLTLLVIYLIYKDKEEYKTLYNYTKKIFAMIK